MEDRTRRRWRGRAAGILGLAVVVLIMTVVVRQRCSTSPQTAGASRSLPAGTFSDTDSSVKSPRETLAVPVSIDTCGNVKQRPVMRRGGRPAPRDSSRDTVTVASDAPADTGEVDTIPFAPGDTAPPAVRCARDTVAPWVYPDPSGGLHRGSVAVKLVADEPGAIEWRLDTVGDWNSYAEGQEIYLEKTATLRFRGVDTCGNVLPMREEHYEIQPRLPSPYCPADMEYIIVHDTRFCIDRFEWPNRKSAPPTSFISVYHAMDSCLSAGKRLCSLDEWTIACSGPYGWRYAYGDAYEPNACVSHDTTAKRSGSRRECRGYFDVYDMSGNLAEWTNTRSVKNNRYYSVMGGFWTSGSDTRCGDIRYSYFPENRHNPVGFRCCKDAAPLR